MAELPYDLQVTCVNKPDRNSPHEAITHLGGSGWHDTRLAVVRAIENREHRFYTSVGGKEADLYVRTSTDGTKFVQTISDGQWSNNLLALLACP